LKLDVKFELPIYDGELNAEKLDNWIKQIEVYCRVQKIMDDTAKIQLATLRLGGTTLIWWESKTQVDLIQQGKVISSWDEFTVAIRKQFYPLAYVQTAIMEWKHLRQGKGKNVQVYTHEFKKKALSLGISLYTRETLLKYIGGMHSYLRHTILMFNPTNIDEVSVQATHLEASKGKHVIEDKKPHKFEKKSKGKWKSKKSTTVKKDEEKPTCSHCKRKGHEEAQCWKLHPELRPKKFQDKGKQKIVASTRQDLGSDSGDESKIMEIGSKGISTTKSNSSVQSAKLESVLDQKKRSELFHVRVIVKHTKIDTLFDSGSQVNLISEAIVKKLGLKTTPHRKPYPLGWVCDDAKLQVTKQCKIRFAITTKFFDEVELDVVPLDICGIVLGSPYLFDRKAIFYREENKYHLFKDGIEFIVRAHRIKTNVSLVSTRKMKRLMNASKYFVLMIVKQKEEDISDALSGCDPDHKQELVKSYLTMMSYFRNLQGFLLRGRLNMKSTCSRMLLFLTLVCIGHQ
jgi:hypothetical protein